MAVEKCSTPLAWGDGGFDRSVDHPVEDRSASIDASGNSLHPFLHRRTHAQHVHSHRRTHTHPEARTQTRWHFQAAVCGEQSYDRRRFHPHQNPIIFSSATPFLLHLFCAQSRTKCDGFQTRCRCNPLPKGVHWASPRVVSWFASHPPTFDGLDPVFWKSPSPQRLAYPTVTTWQFGQPAHHAEDLRPGGSRFH